MVEGEETNGLQAKPKYLSTVTNLVAVTMTDLAAVISTFKVENTSQSYFIFSLQENVVQNKSVTSQSKEIVWVGSTDVHKPLSPAVSLPSAE